MKTIQLQHGFSTVDDAPWGESITAQVSDELQNQINHARLALATNRHWQSIHVEVPPDFLAEDESQRLHDMCRFDVDYISVFRCSQCYFLQSKWDSRVQSEFLFPCEEIRDV